MEEFITIWLLADTHFGLKGDDDEWLDDYVGYIENALIPYMKNRVKKNDILVHCGDVFDNRATLGLNTITRVTKLFEKLSEIFNDIRIVVGNHDMAKKSTTEITGLYTLKHIPHVKIYFEPTVEVIGGKSCLFNPWIEDCEKEKEVLDGVNVDYVFGHLMIGGSQMTDKKGIQSNAMNGVPASAFKNAQVYAGHIHIRQDKKNIHYVGNPYEKDRGDRNNVKGITLLDIKTGKTEFIENTVTPRYIKENIYDILNVTVGELKKKWNNNRIDLCMKGTDYAVCNFDELRSCLTGYYREFNPIGDNTIVELDTSNSDVDIEDMKASSETIGDFFQKQDLEEKCLERIMKKIEVYNDKIGITI